MNIGAVKTAAFSIFLLALSPGANASAIVPFHFFGLGIAGHGSLTVEPNVPPPDPNPLCGTAGQNPCRHDPVGAWRITNISGWFSDHNIGITHAAITGLIPISPENERDPMFDPLVPTSLSFVPAGFSYNNLFFPTGSPIDCDFPFFGTFVDVFGAAFTVDGGYTVNLWGDGNMGPGGALTYGAAVAMGADQLDYQFAGITGDAPEPFTLALFATGLLGAAGLRRRQRN